MLTVFKSWCTQIISGKPSDGARFTPSTTEEKKCFQLLTDLDHVGGFVKGSITSKKHMRNEIWSMISQLGAPSWFITLSPADSRHPICLYYADKNIEFKPNLRSANERNLLVAQNPVAAAHFFDLMVRTFIKHVLGIGTGHSGLYGDTSGYYGTIEQQGRLTLHLHLILWIKNVFSPQEIRDKLMNEDGEFQQNLIKYLEGCQKGEFITGTMEYVKTKIPVDVENQTKGIHSIFHRDLSQSIKKSYQDPTQTQTLPDEPLNPWDSNEHINCNACLSSTRWWQIFYDTVDDILLRSNVHSCSSSDPSKPKFKAKGCLNKDGVCKARFPHPIIPKTAINLEDGYINMKKTESMLNTISPCVTYLFRCNTDVTSLLSGTSLKAVIRMLQIMLLNLL
jgi:helitron helicase-like protein